MTNSKPPPVTFNTSRFFVASLVFCTILGFGPVAFASLSLSNTGITGDSAFNNLTITGLAGSTVQCLHISATGLISGTGVDCGIGGGTWGSITGTLANQPDLQAALTAKQSALGFTPEDAANKSNSILTDATSTTKYPSVQAVKTYADSKILGLLNYRGGYDASTNTYPTTGGSGAVGTVLKGDTYVISIAGTLGGNPIQVGDSITANIDNPGQTSGNWNTLNTNISYVPENVANKNQPNGYLGLDLTGNAALADLTLSSLTGSTQCLHVNASGVITGTGSDCGSGGSVAANPSSTIGLSVINGSAATFMRSDAAPAISQAITPVWTGLQTFNGGLTVNSAATFTSPVAFGGLSFTNATGTGLNLGGTLFVTGAGALGGTTINGNATTTGLTITGIAASNCLHTTAGGVVTGSGSDCGSASTSTRTVGVSFDGGGSALSGAATRCTAVPYSGTIQSATVIADQSGNATVDVKTVPYASYTGPSSASSITSSSVPTLSSAIKYQDTTLAGWTTAIAANTIVCFSLSSPSGVTWLSVTLKVQ